MLGVTDFIQNLEWILVIFEARLVQFFVELEAVNDVFSVALLITADGLTNRPSEQRQFLKLDCVALVKKKYFCSLLVVQAQAIYSQMLATPQRTL